MFLLSWLLSQGFVTIIKKNLTSKQDFISLLDTIDIFLVLHTVHLLHVMHSVLPDRLSCTPMVNVVSPSASGRIESVACCCTVSAFPVFSIVASGAFSKILLSVLGAPSTCDQVGTVGMDLGPWLCTVGLGHRLLRYCHSGVGLSKSLTLSLTISKKSSCLV